MPHCRAIVIVVLASASVCAADVGRRSEVYTDGSGMWVRSAVAAVSPSPAESILFDITDGASIADSVAITDAANEVWVAYGLNLQRVTAFRKGTGDLLLESFLPASHPQDIFGTAAAEAASFGVALSIGLLSGGAFVDAYSADSGPLPVWVYDLGAEYNFGNKRNVDITPDGSIVAAAARQTPQQNTVVAIINGATGAEVQRTVMPSTGVIGLELSDDGSRVLLTDLATARLLDTTTLAPLHSFDVNGAGGYFRLSGDGRTAVAGGFDHATVHRQDETGAWGEALRIGEPGRWYGYALALSDDGGTLFSASYDYTMTMPGGVNIILSLKYQVFDVETGTLLAETTTTGAGAWQDAPQVAQASSDGSVFAVATWGVEDNAHPEVMIFDRALNLIGSVDTPGSPMDLDLSSDGRFLAIGAKAIHANVTGTGSNVISYEIRANGCVCEVDGDAGQVNVFDLLAYLDLWFAQDAAADLDGESGVDVFDLLAFLDCWFVATAGRCG